MIISPNVYGVLLASVASLSWAVFTFLIKVGLRGAPVLKVTAAVTSLNAILVTVASVFFASALSWQQIAWEPLFFTLLAGVFHFGISRSFFYRAIHRLGPNRSIPIAMSYPVVTAVAAAFLLGEGVTPQILAGLAILLGGITLIVRAEPAKAQESAGASASWRAFGWISAGLTSLLWGISAVFFKKAALRLDPFVVSSVALWVGAGVAWLLVFATRGEESEGPIPRASWPWLCAAAACQAVAVPFYNFSFTHTLAVRVSAVISAQPLFVLIIGWFFMREAENITARLLIGATMTVAGTLLVIG